MNNNLSKSFKGWFSAVKEKSKKLKKEIFAIYLAYKRPDVTFYAKLVSILVVGYALSPIDLIPDFIPILGYLDDLILLPLGITLAIKLIPKDIMNECRQEAENNLSNKKPSGWIAGAIIILIWVIIIGAILYKYVF